MPGWVWLVIGTLLFSVEMFLVDAQFYLVFLGVAAIAVGVVEWSGVHLSLAVQCLLFAILAVVSMAGFRKRLYQQLRRVTAVVPEMVTVGDRVQLTEVLAPGQSCRVDYRGSTWTARNIGVAPLSGEVIIAKVEGLTLLVQSNAT